jgi:diguanylate cyclase (GGDEF)-like protein
MRSYLVAVWLAATLAVTGAIGYGFFWSAEQARDEVIDRMMFRSDKAAESVATSVADARTALEAIAAQPDLERVLAAPEECTLTVPGEGAFQEPRLDIVGRDGGVACSSDASARVAAPGVHDDAAWFDRALESPDVLVDWNGVDPATGAAAVVIAAPFGGTARRPAGAAAMFLPSDDAAAALASDIASTESATATVVDEASGVIVSASEGERSPSVDTGTGGDFGSVQGQWAGLDGTQRLFGSAAVADSSWRVFMGAERSEAVSSARGALVRQGWIGLVALTLIGAAMVLLDRRVAGPLRTLTAAITTAGRDPGSPRVETTGTSEVAALVEQFNAMLDLRAGHDAQLLHQINHDFLTGLPNAHELRERLRQSLRARGDGVDLAVVWLGLDRFKNVNDGYGHQVGDRVLEEVADRIVKQLRPQDTLARFAGDEFVVVCESTGADGAISVVERLQLLFHEPFRVGGNEIALQASLGIAITEPAPGNAEQLLREASSAMRQAKVHGGGGWRVFTEQSQERATEQLALERALRDARDQDQFVVHYQPVLDVATGTTVGAEALVRWQHPTRGLVRPLDFLSVAEQTGQIGAIGGFVLFDACRHAARWSAAGYPLRISVNVAASQLSDQHFPALVQQALNQTGLPPEQLCLEIGESALIGHAEEAVGTMNRLRRLGVTLSVDDFGTGYSSLTYLHELPVDELKIDRSFIAELGDDSRHTHLVEAIIRMAHALQLSVVAEGVETADQLDVLTDLGCERAQGYLFAPAQTAQEFRTRLLATATRAESGAQAPV